MIQISQYMLIEWLDSLPCETPKANDTHASVERVLNFNPDTGDVILINIFDPGAWPVIRQLNDIQNAHKSGLLSIVKDDPFARLARPDRDIKEKHREDRDRAWEEMAPLLENETIEFMLDPYVRGPQVQELCTRTVRTNKKGKAIKLSHVTVNKRLRLWWQSGRRRNAFLPNFDKCGAPGERRIAESSEVSEENPKVGRRSALARERQKQLTGMGVRMTSPIYRKFEIGTNKFYVGEGRSLKKSFDLTIAKYFHTSYEVIKGVAIPVLPDAEQLPTFDQYEYWYYNIRDNKSDSRARQGEREYNTKSRPIIGSASQMSFGPGYLYQIDATIPNIYLVNSFRTRIIGRPVLYNCIDVYSVAIAGLCVMLEGPSWLSGIMALDCAFADKVALCAEYGIEIEESDWPICGLPKGLLADRGEFEGYNADILVSAFGMHAQNTGPFRPDWKGYVERRFGIAEERVVKFSPGYVPHIGRARGDPDYDLRAALTVDDFRMLMFLEALDYNMNYYMKGYRKSEYMIAKHVQKYPLEIWNYGIRRTGRLSDWDRDIVRLNLLPRVTATITPAGIHMPRTHLYYFSDYVLAQGWLSEVRDTGKTRPIEIIHDPRTTDFAYLPLDGGQKLDVLERTPACRNLPKHDWHDAVDYYVLEEAATQAAETRRLRSSTRLQAAKDALVSNAVEKTAAARAAVGSQSKSAQRKGKRQAREEEKQRERQKDAWLLGTAADTQPEQALASLSDSRTSNVEGYVPPSSHINRIEEILEEA
jgi:putative transposase